MTRSFNPEQDLAQPQSDSERPRKRVRKGTRSCWECKRRKVRCVFASPSDTICSPCRRRKTGCVSQEFPDSLQLEPIQDESSVRDGQIQERLDRMEALIQSLVERATEDDGVFGSLPRFDTLAKRNVVAAPRITRPITPATPLTRMFDSESKYDGLTQKLTAAWPSQHTLDRLLNSHSKASASLALQASSLPFSSVLSLQDIFQPPPAGSHPVLAARKLLLLGICLQGVDTPTLRDNVTDYHRIVSQALDAASLVTNNDELTNTREGIECIMMESLCHDAAGNLRSAWVAIRRAVSMAQVLGLHRPSLTTPSIPSAVSTEHLWLRLVQTDRFTSLLLGLPPGPATDHDVFSAPAALESCSPLERMRRLDCLAAGKILARGGLLESIGDYAMTRQIDGLLQHAAGCMPPSWWVVSSMVAGGEEPESVIARGMVLMDQFVHFHLVARLHLPHLFPHHDHSLLNNPTNNTSFLNNSQPNTNPKHHTTSSKYTTITATRAMLTRYLAFRSLPSNPPSSSGSPSYTQPKGTHYCHGMDLFAFLAACTLCIAHIQAWCYGCGSQEGLEHLEGLVHSRQEDRGMVEGVLGFLGRGSGSG
ncbi:hypothetical protein B0J18DRAFT_365627, partial [Chaetomium sp. MPI-SDFR-AT-0129]